MYYNVNIMQISVSLSFMRYKKQIQTPIFFSPLNVKHCSSLSNKDMGYS